MQLCFRLDGNLCGGTTAGSVYRNELGEIVCSRADLQRYAFVRGQADPCIFRRIQTRDVLLHHVDEFRATGPSEALAHLFARETSVTQPSAGGKIPKGGNGIVGTHKGVH